MKVAGQEHSIIRIVLSSRNFQGGYQYLKENLKGGKRIQYYMSETDFDKKGENTSYQESTGDGG